MLAGTHPTIAARVKWRDFHITLNTPKYRRVLPGLRSGKVHLHQYTAQLTSSGYVSGKCVRANPLHAPSAGCVPGRCVCTHRLHAPSPGCVPGRCVCTHAPLRAASSYVPEGTTAFPIPLSQSCSHSLGAKLNFYTLPKNIFTLSFHFNKQEPAYAAKEG